MAHEILEYDFKFRPTVSLGYEYAPVKDFGNIQGVNAKIHFKSDYPWGGMVSASYLADPSTWENRFSKHKKDELNNTKKDQAEYFSLMGGPTVRVNETTSLYALAGVSHSKAKLTGTTNTGKKPNRLNFAYGAGVTTNFTEHFALTLGYEGSKINIGGEEKHINGYMINAGYTF